MLSIYSLFSFLFLSNGLYYVINTTDCPMRQHPINTTIVKQFAQMLNSSEYSYIKYVKHRKHQKQGPLGPTFRFTE